MTHVCSEQPRVTVVGTVNASDFEYIRTLKVAQYGESLIARKPDTGTVYTVKLVRKSGHSASELARRVAAEQKIMRVLTECSAPFAARLHWSFEDDRAMYLVIVGALHGPQIFYREDLPKRFRIVRMEVTSEMSSKLKAHCFHTMLSYALQS